MHVLENIPNASFLCEIIMLDVCFDPTLYDEYTAMVKAGNECQFTVHMSLHGKLCFGGLLRGSVVQVKFLLVSLDTLLAESETTNALIAVWSVKLRCLSRITAHIFMRVVDTSSLECPLHSILVVTSHTVAEHLTIQC